MSNAGGIPHGVDEVDSDSRSAIADGGNAGKMDDILAASRKESFDGAGSPDAEVFVADEEGEWHEVGKGVALIDSGREPMISVVAVEGGEVRAIIQSKVLNPEEYGTQGDTILLWDDEKTQKTYALSFRSKTICNNFVKSIYLLSKTKRQMESALASYEVTIANLDDLCDMIMKTDASVLAQVSDRLVEDEFVMKLFDLFEMCEDLGSQEKIRKIFCIVERILLSGSEILIDVLVNIENLHKTIGIFEYDPKQPYRIHHRQDLMELKPSAPQENLPLPQPLLRKIEHTYLLNYFKDRVVARMMDDRVALHLLRSTAALSGEILAEIFSDVSIVRALIGPLSNSTEEKEQKDRSSEAGVHVAGLLFEMGNLINASPRLEGLACYRTLFKEGLLDVAAHLVFHTSRIVRYKMLDFFFNALQFSPSDFRSFLLEDNVSSDSLRLFIHVIHTDEDEGCRLVATEFLGLLLDADNMLQERAEFLGKFYHRYMMQLAQPLFLEEGSETKGNRKSLQLQLELLSVCVRNHGAEMRNYITHSNLLAALAGRVARISGEVANETDERETGSNLAPFDPHERLALINFIGECLELKDDKVYSTLVGKNFFGPLLKLMIQFGQKPTMTSGALIQLFEKVRVSESRVLITHIAEDHADALTKLSSQMSLPHTFRQIEYMYRLSAEEGNGLFADENAEEESGIIEPSQELIEESEREEEETFFWDENSDGDAADEIENEANVVSTGNDVRMPPFIVRPRSNDSAEGDDDDLVMTPLKRRKKDTSEASIRPLISIQLSTEKIR